jgi:glutamate carboxypeptidase
LIAIGLVAGLAATAPAQAKPSRNSATWKAASAEQPAVVETLRNIVSLESPIREPGNMAQLGLLLADRLSALGAQAERIPANTPANGDMIVGRFKGKGSRRIMLMAHMDTVYPAGILARRPFRIEGNTATG